MLSMFMITWRMSFYVSMNKKCDRRSIGLVDKEKANIPILKSANTNDKVYESDRRSNCNFIKSDRSLALYKRSFQFNYSVILQYFVSIWCK
jgi:hypothetical protein